MNVSAPHCSVDTLVMDTLLRFQVHAQMGLEVANIVKLNDIIQYLTESGTADPALLQTIRTYKEQYGVA